VSTRLAVEMCHLRCVVTRPAVRSGVTAASMRASRSIEFQGKRTEAFAELLAAPRADHRDNVRSTRAHPSQRQLRRVAFFSRAICRNASTSFRFCSRLPC